MYKRPSYDIKTTGVFTFKTKDKEYLLKSYHFERENDTEDMLQIQDELRGEIGGVRIKNSAWNKLAKGQTIIAKTSKAKGDISGRLTRIDDINNSDKYEKGGNMNEYSKGGNVIERRYVNREQDYEIRYAKDKPTRKGYKDERKFAVGGEVGNDVTFSWFGDRMTGRIANKLPNGYEVSTDDGMKFVEPQEVINFSEPVAKKKRFGFFAEGGGVESALSILKKEVNEYSMNKYGEPIDEETFMVSGLKKDDEDVYFRFIVAETVSGKDIKLTPEQLFDVDREDKFADGGEIQSKIDKLQAVVNSKMLPESVKEKARKQIAELEKELHESKETKSEEKAEHKAGLWKDKKDKIKVGDFVSFDGGAEGIVVAIRNNIYDLKLRLASGEYVDKRRTKSQLSPSKLVTITDDMKEAVEDILHESKETKAEEKAEHKKARLDEKEELNATIQKLYGIESKAEDLINYQSGGIQAQPIDKIKKYVEYVNKEVSKLDIPFGSEVYDVLADENAHSLNLTLGLLGFYKNEKDSGSWAKSKEAYNKLVDVVNEVKGGGKSEAKVETKERDETEFNKLKEKISGICHDKLGIGITSSNLSTATNTEYTFEPKTKDSKYDGMMLSYDGNEFEVFEFGMATNTNKDTFKVFGRYKNLQAAITSLSKGNTENRNKTTRKAPVRKAPVKKAVAKKTEVKKTEPKPKFKVGDVLRKKNMRGDGFDNLKIEAVTGWTGNEHRYDIVFLDDKLNSKNTFAKGYDSEFSVIPKPKADHKKLVAKLKAKKGAKEYDNRASINPKTGERYKRSESSDKKRDALPLGKRISADGSVYYENRLNRGDLNSKKKFEEGGEVKGSDWSLNLNW